MKLLDVSNIEIYKVIIVRCIGKKTGKSKRAKEKSWLWGSERRLVISMIAGPERQLFLNLGARAGAPQINLALASIPRVSHG